MEASAPDMDTPATKGHRREPSHHKTLARRSTKGPLDTDDPLSTPAPTLPARNPQTLATSTPLPTSPPSVPSTEDPRQHDQPDLTFLCSPQIYHPLPSPLFHSPPASTSTPHSLFDNHNYHAAALSAATRLCTPPHPSSSDILSLFYIRLACLTQLNHLNFAITESRALEDVHSSFYRTGTADGMTGDTCILPWELRVLVTRLHALASAQESQGGGGGPGSAVAGWYELARDARVECRRATGREDRNVWRKRARECAWGVVEALEGEADMRGAIGMVTGMLGKGERVGEGRALRKLVLLYLRVGDVDAARKVVEGMEEGEVGKEGLVALIRVCEGEYADVKHDGEESGGKEVVARRNNEAVSLFYQGRADEAAKVLEQLVGEGKADREVVFNLGTCFELMGERRVRDLKEGLVRRIGEKLDDKETVMGRGDFKL